VTSPNPFEERRIGAVTVLFGASGGKYPDGNSLLVRGPEETLVIDPALGVIPRRAALPAVDRVLNSHCHEDHIAGNHLFPEVPWHLHEADLPGIRTLEGMMAIYGFPEPLRHGFERVVVEQFHFTPRPEARPFRDGDVFELGGEVRVRVIHAPGHTRGHCFFWIEPEDVLYLADVYLSSFGPYYGDAWSSLEDFERTLAMLRDLEPRHWATFHHIGVIDERSRFEERLRRFEGRLVEREARLVDFLKGKPRSLEEIARHRFVYRPEDEVSFAEAVEARSMVQHLTRLLRRGQVVEVESGRFLTA
jgi:glyoxylase-like metal-dependent hydrolase (beta-lactamase superfamily II)